MVGMGRVAQYQPPVSPIHPARAEGVSRLDHLLQMRVSAPPNPHQAASGKAGDLMEGSCVCSCTFLL